MSLSTPSQMLSASKRKADEMMSTPKSESKSFMLRKTPDSNKQMMKKKKQLPDVLMRANLNPSRPNEHQPWEITVVDLIPPDVNVILPDVVASASYKEWHVVGSKTGKIFVFSTTTSPQQQQQANAGSTNAKNNTPVHHRQFQSHHHTANPRYWSLFHSQLQSNHLQLSIICTSDVGSTASSLHVYAYARQLLCLWIIPLVSGTGRITNPNPVVKVPSAKLSLEQYLPLENYSDTSNNKVTLQAMDGSHLYISYAEKLWHVSTTSVQPLLLQIEPVVPPSQGYLSYFLSTSSSSTSSSSIACLLPVRHQSYSSLSNDSITDKFIALVLRSDGSVEGIPLPSNDSASNRLEGEIFNVAQSALQDVTHVGIQVQQASLSGSIQQRSSSDNGGMMLDLVCHVKRTKRGRMYWIRYNLMTGTCEEVWLDQVDSSASHCIACWTVDNGMGYAMFQTPNVPILCLAISFRSATPIVCEVDLPSPQVPSILTHSKDQTTHGLSILSTAGLVLRVRCLEDLEAFSNMSPKSGTNIADSSSFLLVKKAPKWGKQFIAAFLGWDDNPMSTTRRPSLEEHYDAEWEPSVLWAAQKIEPEHYSSFISFLKQGEYYKFLSNTAKWTLLGRGQRLAVAALWEKNFANEIGDLENSSLTEMAQDDSIRENSTWKQAVLEALQVAIQYRDSHATSVYDAYCDPINLWTHENRHVLAEELPSDNETFVRATLEAFQECEPDYERIKEIALTVTSPGPHLELDILHELSIKHGYFEGLCRLSLINDEKYPLEKLLEDKWESETFPDFVMNWCLSEGKYSKVFKYGKLVPETCSKWMEQDDRLEQYRWIHAIGDAQYTKASEYAWQDANRAHATLGQVRFSLGIAKLASLVTSKEKTEDMDSTMDVDSSVPPLQTHIDNRAEIVSVQQTLLGHDDDGPLLPEEDLLEHALATIQNGDDDSIKQHAAMCGLGLAKATDNFEAAASVWAKVIAANAQSWQHWVQSSSQDIGPCRQELLEQTLFGQVWMAVQESNLENHTVQYDGSRMETAVMKKLMEQNDNDSEVLASVSERELRRFLRRVSTLTLDDQSLLVNNTR